MARRTAEIQAWAAASGLAADDFRVYGADVAQADSIIGAGKACIAELGLPDVVIANAGISVGMDTAEREDLDVMAQTFATNNLGMAATFHPFVSAMVERGAAARWWVSAAWRAYGGCPGTAPTVPARPP